jgi:hypothetical protein
MASDTAPAAVPGPENAPPSTAPTAPAQAGTQQPGGLAGLLAPVQPTRSTDFTLTPTQDASGGQEHVHGTSAEFQGGDTIGKQNAGGSDGTGKQQNSVVRAWLLAGAERWKKGADARNKRLDIQKARAQALQVKETRTVSVNRSGGIFNGTGSGGAGGKPAGGKSLSSKSDGGTPSGPKNSPGPKQAGPKGANGSSSGGTGGTGAGPKTGKGGADRSSSGQSGRGGSAGGGGTRPGDSKNRSDRRPNAGPGASKDKTADQSTANGSNSGNGHTTGKYNKKNSHGKTQTTTCGDGSGISPSKDKPVKQNPGGKAGSDGAGSPGQHDKAAKQNGPGTTGKNDGPGPAAANKTPTGKDNTPAAPKPKPNDNDPKSSGKAGSPTDPKNRDPKNPKKPAPGTTPTPAGQTATRRIDLQASREAGYRDGTRTAKATAHVEAWRDGVRDGYRDTKEAAAQESKRLDKAHHEHKKARTQPDKDQPVTQPASSADYQQTTPPKPDHAPGPQPVPVTGVDATHVHLGGGARPNMKHGEVRTLRRFQQVLDTKADRMTQVAEATRALEHHAREQAKQITQLLEQARGNEGGEKLVTALTRLAEAADVQTGQAAEIHKRGVRAADACKTLNANTETRYGGIYKAVIDSAENGPAKMTYYRETTHA